MKPDDIVRYADRIYGYAVKRTFSATKPTSFRRKSSAPRSVRSPPHRPLRRQGRGPVGKTVMYIYILCLIFAFIHKFY